MAIVTGLFRQLAEFVLANQEKSPEHPLIVLEDAFEYADGMDDAARVTLQALFGPGVVVEQAPAPVSEAG